jgi:hypothetical protein
MLAILGSSNDSGGGLAVFFVIWIAFAVLLIVAMWKIFTKAGEAGWKSLIPIYNLIVLLRVVGRPWWWVLLFLIPFVAFIVWIIVAYDLAKSFGKGAGFTVGLILLPFIFYPILGFGDAAYLGPAGPAHPQAVPAAYPTASPSTPPPPMPSGSTPPPPPPPPA